MNVAVMPQAMWCQDYRDAGRIGGSVAPVDPMAPTVFHEPWLLNAATAGDYSEVVVEAGGKLVGRLPFVVRRLRGRRSLCGMPELVHFLGPAIDEGVGADCNRALRRARITDALLEQLPRTSGFSQTMHGGVPDMLAFQQRGYGVSVQFTYEIQPAPEAQLWRNLRDKTRNVVRRAREQLQVCELTDPLEFIAFYNRNLTFRGARPYYADATIAAICAQALRRGQGRILAARAPDGHVEAAIFCLWDARTTYYLMSTRAAGANNGAVSLLVWSAIVESAASGRVFDFDGVTTPGGALFFIGFGGRVLPRYIASRYSLRHRAIDGIATAILRQD